MTHDRLGRALVGDCLVWTGNLPNDGYPRISFKAFFPYPQLVHRVAFALAAGHPMGAIKEIPILDHLCRQPACSSPSHLEPVTRAVNIERGNPNQNEIKTHCDNGHEFTAENTYVRPNGNRLCRTCKRVSDREAYRRKRRPDLVGKPPLWNSGRPRTVYRQEKPRRVWSDDT